MPPSVVRATVTMPTTAGRGLVDREHVPHPTVPTSPAKSLWTLILRVAATFINPSQTLITSVASLIVFLAAGVPWLPCVRACGVGRGGPAAAGLDGRPFV